MREGPTKKTLTVTRPNPKPYGAPPSLPKEGSRKSEALPRSARLKSRRDFEFVQQRGEKFSARDLIVAYRRSKLPTSRIGVTVSTRVDKRSTVRNKIKRRLREIARAVRPRFLFAIDLVLIARASAASASFAQLRAQVLQGLERLKVLSTPAPESKEQSRSFPGSQRSDD